MRPPSFKVVAFYGVNIFGRVGFAGSPLEFREERVPGFCFTAPGIEKGQIVMADEQNQPQAPTSAAQAPTQRQEGGHSAGPRREGGPGGPRREGGPGGPGGRPRGKRQFFRKKKVCKFCVEKIDLIDYKRADILSQFVQERGKILPRRMTGVCARHQRWLGVAIKRARNIALLPFAGSAVGSTAPRAIEATKPAPAQAT